MDQRDNKTVNQKTYQFEKQISNPRIQLSQCLQGYLKPKIYALGG